MWLHPCFQPTEGCCSIEGIAGIRFPRMGWDNSTKNSYCRRQEPDNMKEIFSYFYVNTSATLPSHVKKVLSITGRKCLKACCWQFFSSWLIITDNLNLVDENDENLEVVYSISNMCSDRKANSAEPKNGLWKVIQMMLLDTLAQVLVNSPGILLVIYLSINKTSK